MLFEENAPVKAINPIFGQKIVDKDDLFPKGYKDDGIRAYNAVIGTMHDYDMCMESATFDEIDKYYNPGIEEVDASFILESIVIQKFSRTEHRMNAVVRTLNKHLGDSEIKALPAIVGKPKKTGGFAYVTVQLPFSDGQTVSVIFHAPEGDQKKIAPNDTIVAFRWLLNKRDITHVVSPEEGEEVSLESIGVRVAQLVKKNSARFEATQKQAVEEKKELEEATQAVKDAKEKEQELMDAVAEIKQKEITNDAELSNTLTLLEKQKAINAELQAKLDGLRKTAEQHRIGDGGGNKGVTNTDTNETLSEEQMLTDKFKNICSEWRTYLENGLSIIEKNSNLSGLFLLVASRGSDYLNKYPKVKEELQSEIKTSNNVLAAATFLTLRQISFEKLNDRKTLELIFNKALNGSYPLTDEEIEAKMRAITSWEDFFIANLSNIQLKSVSPVYLELLDITDILAKKIPNIIKKVKEINRPNHVQTRDIVLGVIIGEALSGKLSAKACKIYLEGFTNTLDINMPLEKIDIQTDTTNTDTIGNTNTEPEPPNITEQFLRLFVNWKILLKSYQELFDNTCKSYYTQLIDNGKEYCNKHTEFAGKLKIQFYYQSFEYEDYAAIYLTLKNIPLVKQYTTNNFKLAFASALNIPTGKLDSDVTVQVSDKFVRQAGNWYSAIYNNEQNFKEFGIEELYRKIVEEGDKYLSDPANKEFIQAYNAKTNDIISSDREVAAFFLAVKNIAVPKKVNAGSIKFAFDRALGIVPEITSELVERSIQWKEYITKNKPDEECKELIDKIKTKVYYDEETNKLFSNYAEKMFEKGINGVYQGYGWIASFYLALRNIPIPKDGDTKGFKDALSQALGIAPSNTDNNTGSNTGTGTTGIGWDDILDEDNENNDEVAKAKKVITTLQKKYKCFSETNGQYQFMKSDDWLNENSRLVEQIDKMINSMPKIYSQDGKGDNAVVGMHYYTPNSDYYITELDHNSGEVFGYYILNGDTQNAELGYSSLKELTQNGYELDFYWDKKTLGDVKKSEGIKTDEEKSENNNGGNMPEQTENTAGSNDNAEIQGYVQELEDIKAGKFDAEGDGKIGARLDAIAEKLEQLGKYDEFEEKLNEAAERISMLQRKRSA